jgi:hypothetical protein
MLDLPENTPVYFHDSAYEYAKDADISHLRNSEKGINPFDIYEEIVADNGCCNNEEIINVEGREYFYIEWGETNELNFLLCRAEENPLFGVFLEETNQLSYRSSGKVFDSREDALASLEPVEQYQIKIETFDKEYMDGFSRLYTSVRELQTDCAGGDSVYCMFGPGSKIELISEVREEFAHGASAVVVYSTDGDYLQAETLEKWEV